MCSIQFPKTLYVVRAGDQYYGTGDKEAALDFLIKRANIVFEPKHMTINGHMFIGYWAYGYKWHRKEHIKNDVDINGFMLREFDLPEVKSDCAFVCYVDFPKFLFAVCKRGTGYDDKDAIIGFTNDRQSIDQTKYSYFEIQCFSSASE